MYFRYLQNSQKSIIQFMNYQMLLNNHTLKPKIE